MEIEPSTSLEVNKTENDEVIARVWKRYEIYHNVKATTVKTRNCLFIRFQKILN